MARRSFLIISTLLLVASASPLQVVDFTYRLKQFELIDTVLDAIALTAKFDQPVYHNVSCPDNDGKREGAVFAPCCAYENVTGCVSSGDDSIPCVDFEHPSLNNTVGYKEWTYFYAHVANYESCHSVVIENYAIGLSYLAVSVRGIYPQYTSADFLSVSVAGNAQAMCCHEIRRRNPNWNGDLHFGVVGGASSTFDIVLWNTTVLPVERFWFLPTVTVTCDGYEFTSNQCDEGLACFFAPATSDPLYDVALSMGGIARIEPQSQMKRRKEKNTTQLIILEVLMDEQSGSKRKREEVESVPDSNKRPKAGTQPSLLELGVTSRPKDSHVEGVRGQPGSDTTSNNNKVVIDPNAANDNPPNTETTPSASGDVMVDVETDDWDLDAAIDAIQATTIVIPRKCLLALSLEQFKQACETLDGFQWAWMNDSETAFHARFDSVTNASKAKENLAQQYTLPTTFTFEPFKPEDELKAILHVGDKQVTIETAQLAVKSWIETQDSNHEALGKVFLVPNKTGTVFYVAGLGANLHDKLVKRASLPLEDGMISVTPCTIGYFMVTGFDEDLPPDLDIARQALRKMGIKHDGPMHLQRARETETPIHSVYVRFKLPKGNREARKKAIEEYEAKSTQVFSKKHNKTFEFKLEYSRFRGKKKDKVPKPGDDKPNNNKGPVSKRTGRGNRKSSAERQVKEKESVLNKDNNNGQV